MGAKVKKSVEGFQNSDERVFFENRLKEKNELYYLIWKISLNLALRISDTLNITIQDCHRFLKEEHYLAKDIKTKKINRVKLNANTVSAFKRALELRDVVKLNVENKFLFVSDSNRSRNSVKPVSRISVFRAYKDVCDYHNLKTNVATHSARKTWGLEVYRVTKNIAIVMQRLNHSSESTTLKYLGITQEKINNIVEEFNL